MKISYGWLKDYIDIDLSPEKVAELLTDCGLEVEEIETYESVKGGLNGLVIGEVRSTEKHPDADKLSVSKVDVGNGKMLNIVCGAPNLKAGQKVVVAPPGTEIYPIEGDPFQIKKTKIRGQESEGMICAEDEVGLGTEHDGIMVLHGSAKTGSPAASYFDIAQDIVFDIGLTPNRIDAASHFGVARDLAAVLNCDENAEITLHKPSVEDFHISNHSLAIDVEVEDTKACPRYSGVTITGVEIKESPPWLQKKLKTIGLGPINNIVDITNFVLQETGQPLHAFDVDEIKGSKVVVKKLAEGSKFTTLDEVDRKLSSEDLMICNKEEGMCIAGVFGGINSGVSEKTTSIFLESAYFDPVHIRKTAKHHGLNTDASFRFERGADPNNTVYALKRAAMLITEIAGGEVSSDIVDRYPKKIGYFKLELSYANCDRLIGMELDRDVIKQILTSLEIEVEDESDEGLSLSVPPYRADVQREADVIEEILRIYGYNNINTSQSAKFSFSANAESIDDPKEAIADLLCASGFNEIMANSITKSSYYDNSEDIVKILNPLNAELNVMRQSLLYGGLEAVLRNQNHQRADLKLFEFGKSYTTVAEGFAESNHLTLIISGGKNPESWSTSDEKADFFGLKGVVEKLINRLGIGKPGIQAESIQSEHLQGQAWKILKKTVVELGEINKKTLKKFDIKTKVFYAEFNWDNVNALLHVNKSKYKELPKYSSVRRDLALLVDKGVQYEQVRTLALKTEKNILQNVNLFDVYEGDKIGEGKKSYAVSFTFQDTSKTLQDKDVDSVIDKLIAIYKKELSAEIR